MGHGKAHLKNPKATEGAFEGGLVPYFEDLGANTPMLFQIMDRLKTSLSQAVRNISSIEIETPIQDA